jgi:hypothetical protein
VQPPTSSYRNPIMDEDQPDLDVVRFGDEYVMVVSSSHHVPGLPILCSADLVHWRRVGHALDRLWPEAHYALPRHGGGLWAPAIREHDGKLWIFVPDPDHGVFVLTADRPEGPWTAPHLLVAALGIIDPCPLWDDDGRAWLVFAWAGSRSGRRNLLSIAEMAPDASSLLGPPSTVINGNDLPGYGTLEGPKLYKRDGWYWIFAPAGGVVSGWQSAFRSRSVAGPYQERIVLRQGSTAVNGPHQGAWVTDAAGDDWFLHFQDRGVFGRVTHLQPLRFGADGWPVIGQDGEPVEGGRAPAALGPGPTSPISNRTRPDNFDTDELAPHWHWQANPGTDWIDLRGDGVLRLRAIPDDLGSLRTMGQVLGRSLPGGSSVFQTTLWLEQGGGDVRAGIVLLGRSYAWIGLRRRGDQAVVTAATFHPATDESQGAFEQEYGQVPLRTGPLHLRITTDPEGHSVLAFRGAEREFAESGWTVLVKDFVAEAGHWVAAELGLFATAPMGSGSPAVACFGPATVSPG